jgi:hypothetical protein
MVNYSGRMEFDELHTAAEKHTFHTFFVVTAHHGGVVEITLLCGFLLSQDVTVIGVLSLDFSRAGESETLLGT